MLHGRHVRFDARLILATLLRTLHSFRQAAALLERQSPAGEVAVWQARCHGQTLLHLGSLGLDPSERYPAPIGELSLPLQGSSRIYELALAAVEKLRPRVVFFHHFDDAFPPVSAQIPTQPMLDLLRQKAPGVKAVAPVFGVPVEIE
jgi:L-ascorbate metabolism protein UlaG (beta-lactamase superfamily)